ncbi:hypothetical protein LTR15_012873 [Elasticomyces elasticus]|nr:hypothetical protein LTR15_012873 [Elasticomyces elasticus]
MSLLGPTPPFQAGVNAGSFPATIRDCIVVARALGIRYLWVEAYCIMQADGGGGSEWAAESTVMRKVYANGTLNIGASSSSSAHDGLFKPRASSTWTRQSHGGKLFEIQLTGPACYAAFRSVEDVSVSSNEHLPVLKIMPSQYVQDKWDVASPNKQFFGFQDLFKRAWVYQERLFCSRMLHFGEEQLYWECGSGHTSTLLSEQFPQGMPNEYPWTPYFSPHQLTAPSRSASDMGRRSLTRPSADKFVAFAGVAEFIAHAQSTTFVAGLFWQEMVGQLGWSPDQSTRRAASWRAPSWSWASLDGGVYWGASFRTNPGLPLATAVSYSSELADEPNAYGALTSASIVLECRSIEATNGPAKSLHLGLIVGNASIHWSADDQYESNSASEDVIIVPLQIDGCDGGERPTQEAVRSLLEYSPTYYTVRCVVLSRTGEGTYRRLGAVTEGGGRGLLQLWLDLPNQRLTLI